METSGSVDTSLTTNTVIDGTARLSIAGSTSNEPKEIATGKPETSDPEIVSSLPTHALHHPQSTKVYYHIDDEKTPYCTDVQVPPDKITLGDFKLVLNRSNFKYFCKAPAPDSGVFEEVKVEIRDDNERLHRSANGQFELFLLTSEGSSHSDGSSGLPLKAARHHLVPGPAPTLYPIGSVAYRQAVQQFEQSVVSTDSESMISEMRGLPMHMKGALGRRTYQQQYLMPQG